MSFDLPLVEIEVTDGDVEAVLDCLRSGWLTMGPRTQEFEEKLAPVAGTEHAIAVSSGTAALHLACRAAGIGPGDEVIVPSFTFVATAHAPRYCGAQVVFADAESPKHCNVDPEQVRALIGPRTKAVIAVHFWGYPAEVEVLREICDEQNVILIEDCAEAIGARTMSGAPVGSVGHVGCFSFFSKKQLAIGEGGAVSTDDGEIAAAVRSLRSHGMTSVTWERHRGHGLGYDVTDIGFNYRMDEPHAALGLSRVRRLAADNETRREAVRDYRSRLGGLGAIELPFDDDDVGRSSHFAFPILATDADARDALREELKMRGVQTTWYPALHNLSAYRGSANPSRLRVAAELASRHLVLPLHASLGAGQVDTVVGRLEDALDSLSL
jgi:dTDP-4-amino-4,6-dideoxygalactose transaminase